MRTISDVTDLAMAMVRNQEAWSGKAPKELDDYIAHYIKDGKGLERDYRQETPPIIALLDKQPTTKFTDLLKGCLDLHPKALRMPVCGDHGTRYSREHATQNNDIISVLGIIVSALDLCNHPEMVEQIIAGCHEESALSFV